MHPTLENLRQQYTDLEPCLNDIWAAYNVICATYRRDRKILICGNGGSAADSDHIVGELMKGFQSKRPIPDAIRQKLTRLDPETGAYLANHLQGALPAISLAAHTALTTAIGNDVAGDMIFAQQVFGYGRAGDALIGISTSGYSANVLQALRLARVLDLATIGLTGKSGGALLPWCDVTICVPYENTTAIQERHLPIYHALCEMLELEFFG